MYITDHHIEVGVLKPVALDENIKIFAAKYQELFLNCSLDRGEWPESFESSLGNGKPFYIFEKKIFSKIILYVYKQLDSSMKIEIYSSHILYY